MEMIFIESNNNISYELLEEAKSMEKTSDYKSLDYPIAKIINSFTDDVVDINSKDLEGNLEPNTIYRINQDVYETDDNGNVYKMNGRLIENTTYEIKGITYITDEYGRIVKWSCKSNYEPENERDNNAQIESGGDDREDGDDGGHLVARILGGPSGEENIVPMRDTINRGDYKKSENAIVEATKQGKTVEDKGEVIYEGDSKRPSKIERTYDIDGEKTYLKIDNIKESTELIRDFENDISSIDLENLNDEINDMKADGEKVSVTSVMKKYDANGNLLSVCVGIRNETTGEKTYKTFDA